MSGFNHQEFLSRLQFASHGRYLSSWLRGLGLSGSVVDGLLNRGKISTGNTLIVLQRAENLSLSWLLLGAGPPYVVERPDADSLSTLVTQLGQDNAEMILVTGGLRRALLLIATDGIGDEKIAGQMLDVLRIIADIEPALLAFASERARRVLRLSPKRYARLISGHIGTYQLIGDDSHPGLLSHAQKIDESELGEIAESNAVYGTSGDMLGFSADEMALVGRYRSLSAVDRRRLEAIAAIMTNPDLQSIDSSTEAVTIAEADHT